jgi:asparagine synthase (glutamine-hydrolysing)
MSAPSILPKSLLFKEASRHMKVALAGFGADQMFAGSRGFQTALTVEHHLGRLRFLLDKWPFNKLNDQIKLAIRYPLAARMLSLNSVFTEKELKVFFGDHFEAKLEEAERLEHLLVGVEKNRCAIYINFKHLLFNGTLPVVDRMSSLNGLTVRSPYLDKALMEFAMLLPPLVRMDGRTTKSLIRSSYREVLGAEISDRIKSEDTFPLTDFLAPKIEGEDFHKLISMGIQADKVSYSLKTPETQRQFLTVYALEGFLKQLEIGSSKIDDKVAFRSNLQSLFDENTEGSLEWTSP